MRLQWLNVFLLLLGGACLGISWTARRDFSRPNAEFLSDMAYSPAYTAQTSLMTLHSSLFTQPPGTIPRGFRPLHYRATSEDALLAGQELLSPIQNANPAVLQRGAAVYTSFCQHCHGAGGLGDGPVSRRGFPPPPSLLADHAIQMKDGQMFHAITYGQGNMPAHAAQVEPEDRWKVVAHIRALQNQSTQPAQTAPGQSASTGEGS